MCDIAWCVEDSMHQKIIKEYRGGSVNVWWYSGIWVKHIRK